MAFTHLHLHTEYSLLDGANRIQDLVPRLKELGMTSCAITDHGVMYGVIEFYRAMKAENLKPIIGCEVYLAPRGRHDKVAGVDSKPYHLVLLAKDYQGYQNLMRLVSCAFTEGFYYRPRIDWELLEKYHEGLIGLSACLSGELAVTYLSQGYTAAKEVALRYAKLFGPDNYYIEVQANHLPEQLKVNKAWRELSRETGLPLVATNDCHYLKQESAKAHEVLVCMQTGKKLKDQDRMRMDSDDFYIKSEAEMSEFFSDLPEAISNTQIIADRCNLEIPFGQMHLPKFVPEDGSSSSDYLHKLAEQGLAARLKERGAKAAPEDYQSRLKHELDVIRGMGFVDYFLIVYDFVRFAHEKQIMVGPGRGSGGGSLVAYALRITNIDPLEFNLLFERFLNPDRVSMPDFDLDFCYERRGEIIDYVTEKYGVDHVCQIITFGTLAARQSIRDVARVLDLSFAETSNIVKQIPSMLNIRIDQALEMSQDLRREYDNNPQTKEIIDLARQFEGMPRHASTHAAGVVIADVPIVEVAPLSVNDEAVVVQYDKDVIESIGLIKMDFLGLRTLTVMRDTAEMAAKNHGVKIDFDQIPFDDENVYRMLGMGDTAGVFQLESSGMTSFIKEMKPSRLEDVIAGISLYRPGPMEQIPKYLESLRNPDKISYDHELLEPILNMTYGCIVYQEQVMQIVRDLAGFSMGQADNVRRAMSKKKPEILRRYKSIFIHGGEDESGRQVKGAVANGVPEQVADKIFEEVEAFAGYAFNKSHAAGYAVLAYQTAWLKYYYPVEFMAAMLNSFLGNLGKAASYVRVCKKTAIKVLPPDINSSQARFSAQDGAIRFALGAIKNVGEKAIQQVIQERDHKGKFKTFGDFIKRIVKLDINRKTVESLIKSSALDCFGVPRVQLMAVFEDFMANAQKAKGQAMDGQLSLFDLMGKPDQEILEPNYPQGLKEYPLSQRLAMEKEVLGFYVSGNPLDEYIGLIKNLVNLESSQLKSEEDPPLDSSPDLSNQDLTVPDIKVRDRQEVVMAGIVLNKQEHLTKNNDKMAFLTMEDLEGSYELVVFPKVYNEVRFILQENRVLLIKGKISLRDEQNPNLIADQIIELKAEQRLDDPEFEPFMQKATLSEKGKELSNRAEGQELVDGSKQVARPEAGVVSATGLKLVIRCSADFTKDDYSNLLAMLDYFSGDIPVALYLEKEDRFSKRIFSISREYIELIANRYGNENLFFT